LQVETAAQCLQVVNFAQEKQLAKPKHKGNFDYGYKWQGFQHFFFLF